jgi:cytoskeletal protein RodZ
MIVALEADDFSGMAAPTYAKGFIRLYAGYLGLNPEPLVDEYILRHAPSGPQPLVDENSQLEQNSRKRPAFAINLKWLPAKLNPLTWLSGPAKISSKGLKPYVVKDIRLLAIGAAGLLVLIVLIVSASNFVRRHVAEKSAKQPVAAPARTLLDRPLPDLYLVEPGKIESSR